MHPDHLQTEGWGEAQSLQEDVHHPAFALIPAWKRGPGVGVPPDPACSSRGAVTSKNGIRTQGTLLQGVCWRLLSQPSCLGPNPAESRKLEPEGGRRGSPQISPAAVHRYLPCGSY